MDEQAASAENHTSIERKGDRELVVRRTFDAPPSIVYKAWSQPELFQRWWIPKSAPGVSLVSCDMDVRTGGKYRLEFGDGSSDTMSFYGKYLEEGASFVPKYVELLSAGGSKSPEELAAIAGLDLTDPGFWGAGLDLVRGQLEQAEAAAEEVLAKRS